MSRHEELSVGNLEVDNLTILGFLAGLSYGNEFHVDSNIGVDTGVAGSKKYPFASLDFAIGQCTANNGDVIIIAPGHTESISAAADVVCDVAGITIIGKGHGSDRPTFTFDTAITADLDVTAANITMKNLLFVNGIDNLTAPISVAAADFRMIDCETRDNNSSYHCDDFIVTTDAADRLYIEGWVHRANGGKTGAQTAISIVGGDDIVIKPKSIDGDFATAAIENVTTACDSLRIYADDVAYLRTRNAADVLVTCVATTKGHIGPNLFGRLNDNAANITEAFVGADMEFFPPLKLVNLDGESAMESNITASTDA